MRSVRTFCLMLVVLVATAAVACQAPAPAPQPSPTAPPATPVAVPTVVAGSGGASVTPTSGTSTSTPSPTPAAPAPSPSATWTPFPTPVPGATSPKVVPPPAPTPSATATATDRPVLVVETRAGKAVEVRVEIASTQAARARGLMFRQTLADGDGMLFIFPADTTAGFWMENTLVPLSIAWIDADGVIVGLDDMQPLDRTVHDPPSAYRFALEVPQGFFGRAGVQVGDRFFHRNGTELRPLAEMASGFEVR